MTSAPSAKQSKEPPPLLFKERKVVLDCVQEDGVMKELIRNQEKAISNWDRKWGFMENPRRLWEMEAARRALPGDIFDRQNERRKPAKWSKDRRPKMDLPECTPLPALTSGMIGWRSGVLANDVNRLAGPLYVSPVTTMDPPLGKGEPDPQHQKFIFLG